MVLTGLLLARVTLSFHARETNLISMAEQTLGAPGKYATFLLFSSLFYAILVAYCIAGGKLVADFIDIPFQVASSALVVLFYLALIFGLRSVDIVNRFLMAGLALAYIALVSFGAPHVEVSKLERADWTAGLTSLPVLIIAFGYHNLVPTLAHYLDKDMKALKRAIIIGSLLPLVVYIVWEAVILGIVPLREAHEWHRARGQGHMITDLLETVSHSPHVTMAARFFALFAIATSFLPVAFSFLDFLRDGVGVKDTQKNRVFMGLLVLAPPLVVALTKPHLFLSALGLAGGFCTVLLFGLLPALMAIQRKVGRRRYAVALGAISIIILISTLFLE
jgi:tyrosine-specific transport protein